MRLIIAIIFCFQVWLNGQTPGKFKPMDKPITDFSLLNTNDSIFKLSQNKSIKGYIVIFTCNHCPFAQLYSARLNELNKRFKPLGVPLIAINSMDSLIYDEENFDQMKQKVVNSGFSFPYLWDREQQVGQQFGATHTPQAFVIWKEGDLWHIKYKGLIDDNGEQPEKAKPFVANAVDELLQNKPVSDPFTQSFGCKIFYRSTAVSKSSNK